MKFVCLFRKSQKIKGGGSIVIFYALSDSNPLGQVQLASAVNIIQYCE